jgi:amino acid transporter
VRSAAPSGSPSRPASRSPPSPASRTPSSRRSSRRPAGAALYVNKAFRNPVLTFLITICSLSAVFAASGSLATGFARYFGELFDLVPALLVTLAFIVVLTIVNFVGITESVVVNMVMTFVEVFGLIVVMGIGITVVVQGDADFGVLTEFTAEGSPVVAVIAGVALAFFAMTGFENAANVAEETINPSKTFPRALIGGMVAAGIIYVLVAMSAALVVPVGHTGRRRRCAARGRPGRRAAGSVEVMLKIFAVIAMIAITNTTLVSVVTQSRILYGMAKEDVVPRPFARIHPSRRSPYVALVFSALVVAALLVIGELLGNVDPDLDIVGRLAAVTVIFLLFIYALVIISCLKLRGEGETGDSYRANTVLLYLGVVGNVVLLGYVVYDDPRSLYWVVGLLAVGVALYLAQRLTAGKRGTSAPTGRGV